MQAMGAASADSARRHAALVRHRRHRRVPSPHQAHTDACTDVCTDTNADSAADTDACTAAHADACTNACIDACTDAIADSTARTDACTDAHAGASMDACTDANSDSHIATHTNAITDTHNDANAATKHADSRTKDARSREPAADNSLPGEVHWIVLGGHTEWHVQRARGENLLPHKL